MAINLEITANRQLNVPQGDEPETVKFRAESVTSFQIIETASVSPAIVLIKKWLFLASSSGF